MQSNSQLAHTIQTAGCVTLFCLLVEVALKLKYMHEPESSKHAVIDLRVFVLVWFFFIVGVENMTTKASQKLSSFQRHQGVILLNIKNNAATPSEF